MITGIYVWFTYTKPSGSHLAHIDWAGKCDINRAIQACNKMKKEDLLKAISSNFYKHNVTCEVSIQEIKTGKVHYRRIFQ